MMKDNEVKELVERVRCGDQDAATSLWAEYEKEITRAVKMRLPDELRPLYETVDICQSIFREFLEDVAGGTVNGREHLFRLFLQMARHKITNHLRRLKHAPASWEAKTIDQLQSTEKALDEAVSDRDLFERVRSELTEQECTLVDLRCAGVKWQEIAARMGGTHTPEALRVQYHRLLERVRQKLVPKEKGT